MEEGVKQYDFSSRNDALEGLTSGILAELINDDGIIRWYRVVRIPPEESNGDS